MEDWFHYLIIFISFCVLIGYGHKTRRSVLNKNAQILDYLQELPQCVHAKVGGKLKLSYAGGWRWGWYRGIEVYFTPDSIFCLLTRGSAYLQIYWARQNEVVERIVWNDDVFILIESIRFDHDNLVIKGITARKELRYSLTLKDVAKLPEIAQIAKWLKLDHYLTSYF